MSIRVKNVSLICTGCATTFFVEKRVFNARIKRGNKLFFCSSKCHINYKTVYKTDISCLQCNANFKPDTPKRKFCSQSCFAIWMNAHPTGKMLAKRRKKTKKCLNCDNLIYSNQKYCSSDCRVRAIKVDEGTTLVEMTDKRSYQKHSRIRNLARAKYRSSNKSKACAVCNYSIHYEVCHIKAIKDYEPTATIGQINDLDNLIALCPNHHWELDNGKITL